MTLETPLINRNNQQIMKVPTPTTPNVLYTVKEVAELITTNENYVHKLRKTGLLPFLKLGQYKVWRQSLEFFLEKYEGKDVTDPFNVKEIN